MFRVLVTADSNAARGNSLRRRRVWYAEDDSGNTLPPSGASDGSGANVKATDEEAQKRIDALVGKARKEGREVALKSLLDELGFGDKDELATLVKSARERSDAEKTEAQKLAEHLKAETQKREAAEKALSEREAGFRLKLRNSALETAATRAGAKYPADVLALLERQADAMNALMDGEGNIDGNAVEALINKHKKDRPELYKPATPGTPSNSGGGASGVDAKEQERLRAMNVRNAFR